jgi:glutamate/aspartate transport system permease protein
LSGKKILMVSATVYVNGMRSPLVMGILWFFLLVPASFYTWGQQPGRDIRHHHLRGV